MQPGQSGGGGTGLSQSGAAGGGGGEFSARMMRTLGLIQHPAG